MKMAVPSWRVGSFAYTEWRHLNRWPSNCLHIARNISGVRSGDVGQRTQKDSHRYVLMARRYETTAATETPSALNIGGRCTGKTLTNSMPPRIALTASRTS